MDEYKEDITATINDDEIVSVQVKYGTSINDLIRFLRWDYDGYKIKSCGLTTELSGRGFYIELEDR